MLIVFYKMDFHGKVGIIMAISGVGGSVPVATFRQMNVEAAQVGKQVTSDKMEEALVPVSNFGTETNIGHGQFTQVSEQIERDAVNGIAQIMEQDDDFEPATNGSDSGFGPSGFQQANDSSFNPAMQRAASSYSYFNQ